MYDKKFYTLLDYVFADEGGFSNHKNDRGGRTNFGITQTAMNEYTRKRNLPHKDVKDNPTQEVFKQGWINRVKRIEKRADELIKNPAFRPSYADTETPFDDDYAGGLKKPDNISDPKEKQSLKNKYQYLLNKNGTTTGYAANNKPDIDTRTPSQKLDDEIREKYKRMKNQRLERVFGKSNNLSGKGRWVTIKGNHVYID